MKIVMMSDLHISKESKVAKYKVVLGSLARLLIDNINQNEVVILLFCGDIIDKGEKEAKESFSNAKIIIDHLKECLERNFKSVLFRFVPGNHDICDRNLNDFDEFTAAYTGTEVFCFSYKDVYDELIMGINFIYANSNINGNRKIARTNWEEIEKCISNVYCNLIIAHHSLLSENDDDGDEVKESALRGGSRFFLSSFGNHAKCYYLHGDSHREFALQFDERVMFGVAPLFSVIEDIGKQFLLFNIKYGNILTVEKCIYDGDRKTFHPTLIFPVRKKIAPARKIIYQFQDGYIRRKVAPFDMVQEGGFELYFAIDKKKSLFDTCIEEKQVVLLGEAGGGKSFELAQLAAQISQDNDIPFYPVFIDLGSYVNSSIEDLISEKYADIDSEQLFLIFDAYDEIESGNQNSFAKRVNEFTKSHPNTSIVISARSNFYKFSDETVGGGTFSGFAEYALCNLDDVDLIKHFVDHGIDYREFVKEISYRDLNEMVNNLFYLMEIIKLFKINRSLPSKAEFMKQIIASRFKIDDAKFSTTWDLAESEYEMMQLLEKTAFAMQCMQKTSLENTVYQQLFSYEERRLLDFAGVWRKQEGNLRTFNHNIFREYLVAKYVNYLPFEEVIGLISYPDDKNSIKESWINVLSFLVLIDEGTKLLEWLLATNPEMVVKFELSRIDVTQRKEIFIYIANEFKQKNMWITRGINNLTELVLFGQCNEALSYILNEIREPMCFRSQNNAITLLGEFSNLYGRKDEVKETLLFCCNDGNTRNYEKKNAIKCLAELGYKDITVADELFSIFGNSDDEDIRYGMYCYLFNSNLQNEYVDYFLDGISFRKRSLDSGLDSYYFIYRGLLKIDSHSAVVIVLRLFYKEIKDFSHFSRSEEVFDYICSKARELYLAGYIDILEEMMSFFTIDPFSFTKKYWNSIVQFFDETNTRVQAFERILSLDFKHNHQKLSLINGIADEQCRFLFLHRYENDGLKDGNLFIEYVYGLPTDKQGYNDYKNAVYKKNQIEIIHPVAINHAEIRRVGMQRYFDSLFSIELFSELLDELLMALNNENITYDNLNNDFFEIERLERKEELLQLVWAIDDCTFEDRKVSNFLLHVCWETFSINAICNVLVREDEKVSVSANQKEFIELYCREKIKEKNLSTHITYFVKSGCEYTFVSRWVVFFISYFNFDLSKDVLLDMILLPSYLFYQQENIYDFAFPVYLENHLSLKEISDQVKYNIQNVDLIGDIANSHLKFCLDNKLDFAVDLATTIFGDSEVCEHNRRTAFDYLLMLNGAQYIYDTFLPSSDGFLLQVIAEKLASEQNKVLEECLIDKNKSSDDGLLFLQSLIIMNSEYGMERYCLRAREKNSIPDLSGRENLGSLTESIRVVKDAKLLPYLSELLHMRFASDFKDADSFGLYNSLYSAFKNIAESDYEEVKSFLYDLLEKSQEGSDIRAFCNPLLDEIKEQYLKKNDNPWSIQDVKVYFSKKNDYSCE
ncbi:MAG: metallophosphoesterase [Oscillospiraceae bacterium]|jgi:predicted phosphodiesterase|nr:metallophosphoesterase [Oscillospiraceae bacterium]